MQNGRREQAYLLRHLQLWQPMCAAPRVQVFTNINFRPVDPKHFDENGFVDVVGDVCVIPPTPLRWPALSVFSNSRNVLTICLGKSTLYDAESSSMSRRSNPNGKAMYAGFPIPPCRPRSTPAEGVAPMLFFRSDEVCEVSAKDPRRKAKFQRQTG